MLNHNRIDHRVACLWQALAGLAAAVALLPLLVTPSHAQSFERRVVTDGLVIPWELLWGPDDWLWVTERPGRVSRIDPTDGTRRQILNLPNPFDLAEIGMLGMALHPDFARRPFVYIVDAYLQDSTMLERVIRYTYDRSRDTLIRERVLVDSIRAGVSHGGSRLLFGPDSMLYITIGDKGDNAFDAVDHTKIFGKTLRMTDDGRVPADNPWPHYPWPMSLTWTTGHRNSQGLAFGPHGILYASEHGPHLKDDEVNILYKARNYGWPWVQGPCDGKHDAAEPRYCADSNIVEPIRDFSPSVAPAGIMYYDHPLIDELRGSLLLATMGMYYPDPGRPTLGVVQMKLSEDGERVVESTAWFGGEFGRIRDMCMAPDGRLFLATSNRDARHWPSYEKYASDRIIEIRPPADSAWVTSISMSDMQFCAGDTLSIPFAAGGRFRSGNRFVVELSDSTGSFARSRTLGASTPIGGSIDSLGGTIVASIPDSIAGGGAYAIRVRATRPNAQPTIIATGVRINPHPAPLLRDSVGVLRASAGYVGYRWHLDGADIADADSSSLAPSRSGRYWVDVVDSLGCIGTSNVVEVQVSGAPLVMLPSTSVRLLPQPVRERLIVELSLERSGQVEIIVTDPSGKEVGRLTRTAEAGAQRLELPTATLAAGLYLVDVRTPSGRWSGKVVKE